MKNQLQKVFRLWVHFLRIFMSIEQCKGQKNTGYTHKLKWFQCAFLTWKQADICAWMLVSFKCPPNVLPCVAAVCCPPSCRPYGWERYQCWTERTLHWKEYWIFRWETHTHIHTNIFLQSLQNLHSCCVTFFALFTELHFIVLCNFILTRPGVYSHTSRSVRLKWSL